MAVYHIRVERGGQLSVEAELTVGGVKHRSGRFMAKDKAELRTQTQNVAVMVASQRLALKQIRFGQVNREGGK